MERTLQESQQKDPKFLHPRYHTARERGGEGGEKNQDFNEMGFQLIPKLPSAFSLPNAVWKLIPEL